MEIVERTTIMNTIDPKRHSLGGSERQRLGLAAPPKVQGSGFLRFADTLAAAAKAH